MGKKWQGGWRSKIDPCFDEVIRSYSQLIAKFTSFVQNGQLSLSVKQIELLQDEVTPEEKKVISQEIVKQAALAAPLIFIPKTIDEARDRLSALMERLEQLPRASRNYYAAHIENYRKLYEELPIDQIQRHYRDDPVITCLTLRFELMNAINQLESGEDDSFFNEKKNLHIGLFFYYDWIARLTRNESISELFARCHRYDDNALFAIVEINKALLYDDAIRRRIVKAQLESDWPFFKQLGHAIAKPTPDHETPHYESYLVLEMFGPPLGRLLTRDEIYELLRDSGLRPPDPGDNLNKYINRKIKKKQKVKDIVS